MYIQSRLGTADYGLSTVAQAAMEIRHMNGHMPDLRQVEASYIFCVMFHLVQYCKYVHFHDFE
jgi:hypothetical protein